jgi:hypothetical protein
MRMKDAALFVVGCLLVCFWLPDGARCQTSVAPPLSLAPPSPLTARDSSPPATTNSVWPPMATDDVPPPTATAKRRAPPTTAKRAPPPASAKDPPPTATAKDTPPTAASKRSARPAAAEGTPPTPADNISSTPVIAKPPPSPKPDADYDGFTVGIDDGDTSGQTTRPVGPRPARRPKLGRESDRIEGQQPANQAEDEDLNRKLTICRGCKE